MKKLAFLGLTMLTAINIMAQSSDAAYPVGAWQTDFEKDFMVDLFIERTAKPDIDFGNKVGCGQLTIYNNGMDKELYKGMLTYAGKTQAGNSASVYYFDVLSKQNKTSRIAIKKLLNDNPNKGNELKAQIVKATGDLANNTMIKNDFYSVGGGVSDQTVGVMTEKELLETLEKALENGWKVEGFGNVRQFIYAHAKLDPSKRKYVKCKSTTSVNIRQQPNAQAIKIGELKPNTTLLVVDEYDGWCQVKLGEKQFGWISLTVVTLTNISIADNLSNSSLTTAPSTTNIAGLIPSYFIDQNFFKTNWNMAPAYTDLARQGVKGNVHEIIYTFTGKFSDDFTFVIRRRQISYDNKGMMTREDLTYNDSDFGGQGAKTFSRQIQYKYDAQGRLVAILPSENEEEEILTYNSQGKLIKSKIKELTYTYSTDGRLLYVKGENGFKLTYNKWGLICQYDDSYTQKNALPYVKPSTITYDVNGMVQSVSICQLDGMDDIEYIEKDTKFTYNEKGDIVKVVLTCWDCNSKWARKKVSYSESYSISYAYDEQGNWIKATIKTLASVNEKRSITINRGIKYW